MVGVGQVGEKNTKAMLGEKVLHKTCKEWPKFYKNIYESNIGNGDDNDNSINTNRQLLKNWCQSAGVLYYIIIFCGMFAEVGIRERYINFSSASETANNIANHTFNFRSAVIIELTMCCSDVGVAILLGAILYMAADGGGANNKVMIAL